MNIVIRKTDKSFNYRVNHIFICELLSGEFIGEYIDLKNIFEMSFSGVFLQL